MKTIRVAVSDDHPAVLMGVASWVELTDGLELVGTASNPESMKQVCATLKPDLAVVDLVYGGLECVGLVDEIKQVSPDTKVIIYSAFSEARQVMAALECGADGYLCKEPSSIEISGVIREVYQNSTYLDPCIIQMVDVGHPQNQGELTSSFKNREEMIEFVRGWYRQILERDAERMMELLTQREQQILLKRLDALTDIEAAYAIGLGEADYKNRMSTIRRKLQMPKAQILKLVEIFRNMMEGNPEET